MKTIKINGRNLESALSLEETLFSLNLQVGSEYGTLFGLVLKIDLKAKTYILTLPADNEKELPIAWIGNYSTNDRQEYTSLMLEKVLEDATRKLENDGLELWANTTAYVLGPSQYQLFSNKSAIKR